MAIFGSSESKAFSGGKHKFSTLEEAEAIIREFERTYDLLEEEKEKEARVHELDKELLEKQHKFEIEHFESDKVMELEGLLNKADSKISVLEKEKEMLTKITDLNGDIIDIKDLVAKLIEKLPSIDLKSLTVNNSSSK